MDVHVHVFRLRVGFTVAQFPAAVERFVSKWSSWYFCQVDFRLLNLFEYVNGECLDAQSATNIIFNSCLTSEDEVVSVPWTIKHNSNNMSVFQNISWRTVMLIVTSSVHIRTTQCVSSLALYSITLILLMTTVMFKPVSALRCCWKQEHVTTRLFIAIDSMTTLVPT